MDIKNSIRTLRIFALLLFITPSSGLLGSLVLHNYLVNFKYTHEFNYNFKEYKPGNSSSPIIMANLELFSFAFERDFFKLNL